ncbi:MAG: hypothetical protein LVQ63_05705 [Thermoplasmatales archaeon]|nr:hypothetical protein [Thermoplasmatales archaeon]
MKGCWKNGGTIARGSPYRSKGVRKIRKIGLESWKRSTEYGKRLRVEIFLSALKRVVGETIRARRLE